MNNAVFSFGVRLAWRQAGSEFESIINARTRGQAKVEFFHDLDGNYPYTAIRARKLGPPHTSREFLRNAIYRGMPDVRCGQRVRVHDMEGVIVGHNISANFDVLFDDGTKYAGCTLNVHPSEIELMSEVA